MNRKSVFWVPSPDDTEDLDRHWLSCRLAGDWFATDGDRAIIPVTKIRRDNENDYDERSGLLVQYGGADLVLDLVGAELEQGDEFVVINPSDGRPFIDDNHEAVD
ncbi:MAG: hypothetical protein ABEI52_12760 [Halobacteriaceae archaeon]